VTIGKLSVRKLAAGLSVLAAVGLALAVPHAPDLDVGTRARRLIPFHGWATCSLAGNLPYQRLPDGRVLENRLDGSIHLLDPRTGGDTAVPALANAFAHDPRLTRFARTGPWDWLLSRDGRWLLTDTGTATWSTIDNQGWGWSRQTRVGGPPVWVAARLDGRQVTLRPQGHATDWNTLWTLDSAAWIQFPEGHRPTQATLGNAAITAAGPTLPNGPMPFYSLGWVDAHDALLASWADSAAWMRTTVVDTDQPSGKLTVRTVMAPGNGRISEVEMSPDGRRLAWAVYFPRQQLPPFLGFLPNPWRRHTEIWVTAVDGTDAQEVLTDGADPPGMLSNPEFVRWSPDGNSVTFVYEGSLWTAPAR
jgi:hypothetical protein